MRKISHGGRYINPCVSYYPKFQLGLREDDKEVLLKIQGELNIGYINTVARKDKYIYKNSFHNTQNQCVLQISKKADLLKLVIILENYPLQSKKAKDFTTWSLAVIEKEKTAPNRLFLEYLYEKLKHNRKFGNSEYPEYTESFVPIDIPREWINHDRRFGLRKGSRRWLKQIYKGTGIVESF